MELEVATSIISYRFVVGCSADKWKSIRKYEPQCQGTQSVRAKPRWLVNRYRLLCDLIVCTVWSLGKLIIVWNSVQP